MTPENKDDSSQSKPRKHSLLAWLLVLVIVGLLLIPLLHKSKTNFAGGPPGMGGGTAVTVSTARKGTMDLYLDALGTVTPLQTVNVYSQVSGRVLSVNYREGQMVKKGQLLVEIDPRPIQAQLLQSEGALARDKATLEQNLINLKRYQDAFAQKAVSQQTVFDQSASVQQSEGTVKNDEGSVDYYKVQLSYCHIVAPINGRIGLRLVDPGNTIFSGSSSTIATITQLQPITAVFSIAEDHVPTIEKQIKKSTRPLSVNLYDRTQLNQLATGKLLTFDNQIDTSTGTVKLRAQFENANNELFPNQFVNARLQVSRLENAVLIPTVAIQYNGQQAYVYTVQAKNIAKLQAITVRNSEGPDSAIEGIQIGDIVVTSNFDRIQEGAAVTLPGAKAAGAPGPPQ